MKESCVFTLVMWLRGAEDGVIHILTSRPYKTYCDRHLKKWVLRKMGEEYDYGNRVEHYEVFKGQVDDFHDWYDLDPIYLDIS